MFSTNTGFPNLWERRSAIVRDNMSIPIPGPYGTTIFIGRAGHSWLRANCKDRSSATTPIETLADINLIFSSAYIFVSSNLSLPTMVQRHSSLRLNIELFGNSAPAALFFADKLSGAVRCACALRREAKRNQSLLDLRTLEVLADFPVEAGDDIGWRAGGCDDGEKTVHNDAWQRFANCGKIGQAAKARCRSDRNATDLSGVDDRLSSGN